MKAGNGAGFAPGSTRARKRDDDRWRADTARAMRIRYHKVAPIRVLYSSHPAERAVSGSRGRRRNHRPGRHGRGVGRARRRASLRARHRAQGDRQLRGRSVADAEGQCGAPADLVTHYPDVSSFGSADRSAWEQLDAGLVAVLGFTPSPMARTTVRSCRIAHASPRDRKRLLPTT
jgi:hypothetical protein